MRLVESFEDFTSKKSGVKKLNEDFKFPSGYVLWDGKLKHSNFEKSEILSEIVLVNGEPDSVKVYVQYILDNLNSVGGGLESIELNGDNELEIYYYDDDMGYISTKDVYNMEKKLDTLKEGGYIEDYRFVSTYHLFISFYDNLPGSFY